SNFDKNNQIIGNVLKSAMNGKIPSAEAIAKGEIPQSDMKFGTSGEIINSGTSHYQTGTISNNSGTVQNVRHYNGNKIPLHIQQKIGQTFSPDYKNFSPYTYNVKLVSGKTIPIVVRETPIYVVATLTNGQEQTEILYPINTTVSKPSIH
ncbi:MAG: hypothetical protein RSD40_07095, partial [Bacilli bacterium]